MTKMNERIKRGRHGLLRRCLSTVLAILTFFGSFSVVKSLLPTASAAETKTVEEQLDELLSDNALIMTAETGSVGGSRMPFLQVRYYDTSDIYRVDLVPIEKAHEDLLALAKKIYAITATKTEGITMDSFVTNSLNCSFATKNSALAALSTQQLYFETTHELKTLCDVVFYGASKTEVQTGRNEWGCQAFSVVKPDRYLDASAVGGISAEYNIRCTGELLYNTTQSGTLRFTQSKRMFPNITGEGYKATAEIDEDKKAYESANGNLYVEIDINDTYGAGLEYLINGKFFDIEKIFNSKQNPNYAELIDTLVMKIEYADANGFSHTISLPVISTYLYYLVNSEYGATKKNYPTQKLLGLLQQGDTIAFPVNLPSFATAKRVSIAYTSDFENFSFVYDTSAQTNQQKVFRSKLESWDTSFAVSAIRLKTGEASALTYSYDGTKYVPGYEKDVSILSYALAASDSGIQISLNSGFATLTPEKYQASDRVKYVSSGEKYILAITTDQINFEYPAVDLYITLNYKKNDGEEMTSVEYNVAEQCADFYGEMPVYASPAEDSEEFNKNNQNEEIRLEKTYAYYRSMVGDKPTLYVPITLGNVASFVSATLRKEGTGEWQMKSLEIYRVTNIGERKATWSDTAVSYKMKGQRNVTPNKIRLLNFESYMAYATANAFYMGSFKDCLSITREFYKIKYAGYSKAVLLQDDKSKTISFADGEVEENKVDWNKYQYTMTYEDTKQDLGFAEIEMIYKVEVQVSGDVVTDEANEDCGSKNQFYFQLIFANGKSGYVLANQQLGADGFRTGKKETFYINVNRNYGSVRSVHIIPQDPNSEDEAYDKLRIDYINIARADASGISSTWTIEIKDWISINYSDAAVKDSIMGQSGLSESELARTFNVTSNTCSASLMFEITTGAYNDGENFDGHVDAIIRYVDQDGVDQTEEVDVIAEINRYANTKASQTMKVGDEEVAKADTLYMFRAYHSDRFFYNITGLKSVTSIQFVVTGTGSFTWNVTNINVYVIDSKGQIIRNSNGEYEVLCDKQLLCSSKTSTEPYSATVDGNTSTMEAIRFTENSVELLGSAETAEITTYPENKDDTMNVYVYMSNDADSVSDYNMACSVSYCANAHTENGVDYVGSTVTTGIDLKKSVKDKMFYAVGVNASGLYNVSSVTLKSKSISNVSSKVNRVVIEHVRSGVIIGIYEIAFYDYSTDIVAQTFGPSGNTSARQKQVLTFQLTDNSEQVILSAKAAEVAVSITYTTLDGNVSHTLQSPNVFLTDSDVDVLQAGGVYSVTFNQYNVKKITAINFIASGTAINQVGIKNAYIANYEVATNGQKDYLRDEFSFADGIQTLGSAQRSMLLTSDESYSAVTVTPVTFTIKTAQASEIRESGTTCPVSMTLNYYDKNNNVRGITYNDLASYAVSGSTKTGDTMVVTLLLNNFTSMRSATIEPKIEKHNDVASWSVESISIDYLSDMVPVNISRMVNAVATEGEALTVNLADVSMEVVAVTENPKTGATTNQTFYNTDDDKTGVQMSTTQTYTLYPDVSGSTEGVSFAAYEIVNDNKVSIQDYYTVKGVGNDISSVVFTPDSKAQGKLYCLVFTSVEFSSVVTTVYIKVNTLEEETTQTPRFVVETTTEEQASTDASTTEESTALPVTTAPDETTKSVVEQESTTVEEALS